MLCLATQSCLILCDPMNCGWPGSSAHGNSPGKNTGVGCHDLLQGNLPDPGFEPGSPALQGDSLLLSTGEAAIAQITQKNQEAWASGIVEKKIY